MSEFDELYAYGASTDPARQQTQAVAAQAAADTAAAAERDRTEQLIEDVRGWCNANTLPFEALAELERRLNA